MIVAVDPDPAAVQRAGAIVKPAPLRAKIGQPVTNAGYGCVRGGHVDRIALDGLNVPAFVAVAPAREPPGAAGTSKIAPQRMERGCRPAARRSTRRAGVDRRAPRSTPRSRRGPRPSARDTDRCACPRRHGFGSPFQALPPLGATLEDDAGGRGAIVQRDVAVRTAAVEKSATSRRATHHADDLHRTQRLVSSQPMTAARTIACSGKPKASARASRSAHRAAVWRDRRREGRTGPLPAVAPSRPSSNP